MLKKIKELLRDLGVYGITSIASQFVGFILLPLYTSYLSPRDYGILAMVGIVKSVFITIGNLGLKSAVMRFVSRSKNLEEAKQYYATIYYTTLTFSVLFLLVCLFFSREISYLFLDDASLHAYITYELLSSWLLALGAIPSSYLRIKRKVWTASLGGILNLSVTIISTIFMVVVLEWGVLGAILGSLSGTSVQKVYFLYYVPIPNWRLFDRLKLRESIVYSYPYIPHYLMGVGLAMFGQFMVKEMLSLEAAGLYNIAYRFSLPLVFIVDAFNKSWGPYQFEIYEKDPDAKNTYRSFFSIYIFATTFLYLGLAVYGEYLLKIMVDERFYDAAIVIPFVTLIPLAKGIYYMLSTTTYYASSPKYLPLISSIGMLILVVSAYSLVPILNAEGAALSTTLGWISMAIGVHIYAQKIFYIPYDWRLVIPIWMIVLAFTLTNLKFDWIVELSFFSRTVIVLLFALMGTALFYLSNSEKKRMIVVYLSFREKIFGK